AALERAAAYAKERVVFSRPIGQNQSVQHPLAQNWMQLEAARLMIMYAAWQYDCGLECGAAANAAKYLAAEAGRDACQNAVMSDSTLQLDHLNMPARDPEGLARWYAETFGLQANAHVVRGPGVLLAFVRGEPVNRAPDLHIGLHVPSTGALKEWARKFDVQL